MKEVPRPLASSAFGMAFQQKAKVIYPIKLAINETMVPVSTATMVMPREAELFGRNYVFKLFTAAGVSGYYRVQSFDIDYSSDTVTYQLEHMIAEVGDWCIMQAHSGNYAAATAIRRLWRGSDASGTSDDSYRGDHWVLGDMTVMDGVTVELEASNRANLLTSLLDVMDGLPGIYMDFDYSEYPWIIDFSSMSASAYQDRAHGRLSRNISSANVSFDFTDLCTRARYVYSGTWRVYNAEEQQGLYGIVEGTASTSGASSLARAQYMAKEFLRKNQEPRISISMSGQDLYAITGITPDRLKIGKLFTLFVPELDTTITRNITSLKWNDVYNDPLNVSVTLGEEDPTLWAYLKSIKKK